MTESAAKLFSIPSIPPKEESFNELEQIYHSFTESLRDFTSKPPQSLRETDGPISVHQLATTDALLRTHSHAICSTATQMREQLKTLLDLSNALRTRMSDLETDRQQLRHVKHELVERKKLYDEQVVRRLEQARVGFTQSSKRLAKANTLQHTLEEQKKGIRETEDRLAKGESALGVRIAEHQAAIDSWRIEREQERREITARKAALAKREKHITHLENQAREANERADQLDSQLLQLPALQGELKDLKEVLNTISDSLFPEMCAAASLKPPSKEEWGGQPIILIRTANRLVEYQRGLIEDAAEKNQTAMDAQAVGREAHAFFAEVLGQEPPATVGLAVDELRDFVQKARTQYAEMGALVHTSTFGGTFSLVTALFYLFVTQLQPAHRPKLEDFARSDDILTWLIAQQGNIMGLFRSSGVDSRPFMRFIDEERMRRKEREERREERRGRGRGGAAGVPDLIDMDDGLFPEMGGYHDRMGPMGPGGF
eukprot:gnl/Dysnectes_brevis/2319_a2734_1076.p1 GENE.gnl/Dysnectes_brevis/2319_a2734_1076~~gnl/Dysnectes_brevis/2319_a2734_1076.p1  ORF type:complete len:501 (-),score=149.63 gnl/Dysnectes_brevis/2319_a2734_1076:614-2071(-)